MDERILRARARENLRNNWGVSIAVAVVAVLLGGLITGTSSLPELQYGLPLDHFPALQKFVASEDQGLRIGSWGAMIGGIAGWNYGTIKDCWNDGYLTAILEDDPHLGRYPEISFGGITG